MGGGDDTVLRSKTGKVHCDIIKTFYYCNTIEIAVVKELNFWCFRIMRKF